MSKIYLEFGYPARMPKPPRPWTVTPHDPIEKLEDNLWTVESQVPGLPIRRRMCMVKRSDGQIVFLNAVPLDDAALAEVTAWGKPAFLVIPHDQHGIDAFGFTQKLGVKIYGPKASEAKMRAKWEVAGTLEDLPPDPAVKFESLDGSKTGEPVGIVRSGERVSLLFSDAYQDNAGLKLPLPLRILGFGGGPKVVPLFKWLFTKDKAALKAHFDRLAALPGLERLVPCHGNVKKSDAAATLKQVAASA
jgi:hypothetical protein